MVGHRRAKGACLEQSQLVAYTGRLLEFQIACMFQHLLFQALDFARNVFFTHIFHLRPRQRLLGQAISLAPGADALQTAELIKARVNELTTSLPEGLKVAYANDTTAFIKLSVEEVVKTLLEAIVLVFLVAPFAMAAAEDKRGCSDHPLVTRMPGYVVDRVMHALNQDGKAVQEMTVW